MLRPIRLPEATSRRIAVAVAAVVLLAAMGFTALWLVSAESVRGGVAAWVEARRAEGYTVAHQELEVSGFPFRLTASVAAPAIAQPDHPRAWAWTGDRVVVEARPWSFDHFRITLPTRQQLGFRPDPGAERIVATATVEEGVAWLELVDGAIERVTLAASRLVLAAPGEELRLARLDASGRRVTQEALELSIAAEDIILPSRFDGPLGREVARVATEATVLGSLTPAALPVALDAWRDAGGTVEIAALEIRWRDLMVAASGTLAVDRELRPLAALSTEIEGYQAIVDALAAGGAMNAREAALATTALDLIAKRGEDGAQVLKLPLTARSGTLFIGPLALARLSPLVAR